MKTLLILIILIHGVIHFFGFLKAYKISGFHQVSIDVSRFGGLLWFFAGMFFIVTAVFGIFNYELWWVSGILAVIFSQVLLISWWKDARYGTFANTLVLAAVIFSFFSWHFENRYKKDVVSSINRSVTVKADIVTENDLKHLPDPVQKYLRFVGVVNKPKVYSFRAVLEGDMRDKELDWFKFYAEQHNFYDQEERLFFMKANIEGMPTYGFHSYKDGRANMQIKLLSMVPVVNINSKELLEAETVTLFNDMCLFAPASLIDKNITWEEIDPYTVKAYFSNNHVTISATLFFNSEGKLINFISDDRYALINNKMEKHRFSTPVKEYSNINGYNLFSYGETIWHYPDGDFKYGIFYLKELEYNIKEYQSGS